MIPSVSREAELELTDAATYYAKEGSVELGLAFIDEFEQALDLLCQQPQLGALWRARRRLPLRRFPYSVIYYVSGDSLRVIALAHHRRAPDYWSGRK
jgi:plasmid stabilization system protein ParE